MKRLLIVVVAVLLCGCGAKAGAVDVDEYVPVADARLYVAVRGEHPQAPLLLWLHGGPGGAERPLFRLFNAPLERKFVVAYLDQRGTARSFDAKADPHRLTIAQHLADLDTVIDRLRREFGKTKVILVGHSWGSALGILYAQAHPEKVAAFAGVGQVTSELARETSQYTFVEGAATKRGDTKSLSKLAAIGHPPFTAARELAMQELVDRFGGYWHRRPNRIGLVLQGVFGGYVMPWEFPNLFRGNNVSLEAMNDELLKLDLPKRVPVLKVPVIFLLGRYDRQVDSRLAARYFEKLAAPAKRLMWFENAAHNVPFEEPDALNTALPKLLADVGAIPHGPGSEQQ